MMRKKDDNDEERQRIDHKERKSHKNRSKLLSDLNTVPTKSSAGDKNNPEFVDP